MANEKLTNCKHCSVKLKEVTNPSYGSNQPIEKLWCYNCGTIHVVRGRVYNHGPDSEIGFEDWDEIIDIAIPNQALLKDQMHY